MNISTTSVQFLISLAVPFFLLGIGALGKHLIVGEFRWSNFYLGPEFSLAANICRTVELSGHVERQRH
jgi:hypothetical protein